MTSVIGHLTALDFESHFRGWTSCPPSSLFEAPVQEFVSNVRNIAVIRYQSVTSNFCIGQESSRTEH